MARKKRAPIEEKAREGLTDRRFKNPLDKRVQSRRLGFKKK